MTKPALVKPRWESPEPTSFKGSYGPRIEKWAKEAISVTLDPWQSYVLNKALRYKANGDLIYRTVLVGTARQSGKSVLARVFAGWLLAEGHKIEPFSTWTAALMAAHDAPQARLPYQIVYGDLASNPTIRASLKKLTEYRGIQGGKLKLDTVTGQPGSARGRSAGIIFLDEVQEQKDAKGLLQALRPTQAAQRSAMLFMTATAGHVDSEVLRTFYDRLKAQADGIDDPAFYGAWWESNDPDAGLDWTAVRQATPSLGYRISKETVAEEFRSLPADAFKQERLNHFAQTKATGAFNENAWKACHLSNPLENFTGNVALGIDIAPDWTHATICVAGIRSDNRVGVEVHRSINVENKNPITAARIIAEVERFCAKHDPITIAYDFQCAGSAAFERHALETGLPYDPLKVPQLISAAMDVTEMILSNRLAVNDSPLLNSQILNVAKRKSGQEGAFRFSRAVSEGEIDAVLAMTFAAHAISYQPSVPKIF